MDLARTMACLDCTSMMAEETDPLELCQKITSYLQQAMLFRRTVIILNEKTTNRPLVFAFCTDGHSTAQLDQEITRLNRHASGGILRAVLQSGRELVVQSDEEDAGAPTGHTFAEACFPILDNGHCIGVLGVEHATKTSFSHDDLMLLKIVTAGLTRPLRCAYNSGMTGLSGSSANEPVPIVIH